MYQFEIDSLYQEYSKIIVPRELPYNNVPVIGYRKYIEFLLLDVEKGPTVRCILVLDSLNEGAKKRISGLPQLADNWYYEIMNNIRADY